VAHAQGARIPRRGRGRGHGRAGVHHDATAAADNARIPPAGAAMQKLLIIAFLVVILWNLGAGLYYMMVDKGTTDRTVRSLSWRIGISVVLFLIVVAGIATGWIKPLGIYH
jgi:succinate dehydrogenase/fumarate reductase cytochrome b subunit